MSDIDSRAHDVDVLAQASENGQGDDLHFQRTLGAGLRVLVLAAMGSWLLCATPSAAQSSEIVALTSPQDGEILTGTVEIEGTLSSPSFLSGEVAFAYADDQTDTWFTISEVDQSVVDDAIAPWDTSAISDGDYKLRLRLNTLDGRLQEVIIAVQVRNYTAARASVPSASPTSPPALAIGTPAVVGATPAAGRTPLPMPTPLPANAAALTSSAVIAGFSKGALAVLALCLVVGVLLLRRRG